MADNITITAAGNATAPAGTVVGSDDVGGVQIQRVKLDWGSDGATSSNLTQIPSGSNNIGGVDIRSALQAGENFLGYVGGDVRVMPFNMTRPANTTPYAAGDIVATGTSATNSEISLGGIARKSGGTGTIRQIAMADSGSKSPAPVFEVWFWDFHPPGFADNAVFAPTDANCASVVGIATLTANYQGAASNETGNLIYQANNLGIDFVCTSGASLWATVLVRNAYTPISAEDFRFRFTVARD